MDGPGEYYAKWNKLFTERQIPYDLTYMQNLINNINKIETLIEEEVDNYQRWMGLGLGEKTERIKEKNKYIQATACWLPEGEGERGTRRG